MDKDKLLKDILKIFFYRLVKCKGSAIKWDEDVSAYEVEYSTKLAKINIRIYSEYVIVFSNNKDNHCKKFDEFVGVEEHIDEILQDSIERF